MSVLKDKVVLVTGASSGIGLATAELFKSNGASVVAAQRSKHPSFHCLDADFLDPKTPKRVIDEIERTYGRLDVLVNNAGLMREGSVDAMPLEDWHNQIMVNLTAPFLLCRYAMPLLIKAKGAIVNTGSIEGLGSNPTHPAYCASKAGLHGLTRAMAVDHGKDGVRCNAVAPGWIDTPLNEDYINNMPNAETFRDNIGSIHPIRRTGKPEEVAELIYWLASEKSSFVTGQIYTIDGGRTSQLSLP